MPDPIPPIAADPWPRFLAEGILGSARLIENARVELSAIDVGSRLPVVTNRAGEAACSWVASLRNAYGPYARAETDIVPMHPVVRGLYVAGSHTAEALLRAGGLAGGVFLNNWLLATNLYAPEFTLGTIRAAVTSLARSEPRLPIVIRSLTPALHGELLRDLASDGFLLLPSRQVWILHDPVSGEWRRRRDARRDLALAAATADRWEWVPATSFHARDYARCDALYQQLYRQRYPRHNPDYTEAFLRLGVQTGLLDLRGLRQRGSDTLVGFIGMVHRSGVSCTPLLGYDTQAPESLGLYRLLMLQAFLACERLGTTLHCSAGAGLFKFNRGARSHIEFSAVWARHLPIYRRACLRSLAAAVTRAVVPYLESHRL